MTCHPVLSQAKRRVCNRAQRQPSHPQRQICDDSFLDSFDFPELFAVLGALPDGKGRILGIASNSHRVGTALGSEIRL